MVYFDDFSAVFVRDSEENTEVIDSYAYHVVRPSGKPPFQEEGQEQEALNEYQRALAVNPDFVGGYADLAAVYEYLGEYEMAIEHLHTALELVFREPRLLSTQGGAKTPYVRLYTDLANIHVKAKDWDQAIHFYTKTLELDENNPLALNNLSLIYTSYQMDQKKSLAMLHQYAEYLAETKDKKTRENVEELIADVRINGPREKPPAPPSGVIRQAEFAGYMRDPLAHLYFRFVSPSPFNSETHSSWNWGVPSDLSTAGGSDNRSIMMGLANVSGTNMRIKQLWHRVQIGGGNFRIALYFGGASIGDINGATLQFDSGAITTSGAGYYSADNVDVDWPSGTVTHIAAKLGTTRYYYVATPPQQNCELFDESWTEPGTDTAVAYPAGPVGAQALDYGYCYQEWLTYVLYPTISSVTPSSFGDTDTGIVIAGDGFEVDDEFGAGTSKVWLTQNNDWNTPGTKVQQTDTAWSNTSITFTVVQGALSAGNVYLWVENSDGEHNASGETVTMTAGGPTTTIGDGTSPANKDVAPESTNNAVDAFTLVTNTEPETVTALSVTFTGTDVNDVAASGVKIYEDDGGTANEWDATDTLIDTVSFSGSTASFTGLNISVNTSATQYLVTYDIAAGATDSNTLQGAVTAATVTNTLVNNDAPDATLTVNVCTDIYFNRKKITIQSSQVSGSSDFTDFPVLISLSGDWLKTTTADPTNGRIENANGYDIIFKDSTETVQLDHEIDLYDGSASGGTLLAWVRIPTLDYNDDTIIYMHYGNDCISSSQENVPGVWDSDYVAVWHLKESGSTVYDSTSNNNDGSKVSSPSFVDGKIGKAYNTTNGYFSVPYSSSLDFVSGSMFIECWAKYDDFTGGTDPGIFVWGGGDTDMFGFSDPTTPRFRINSTTLETGTASADTWYYYVGRYTGSNMYTYHNTSQLGSVSKSGNTAFENGTNTIGYRSEYSSSIDGIIDELRISKTDRGVDYMTTTYNNQNSPATFYNVEDEECSYSYRRPITIKASEVSGTSDLTDFPVLVSISDTWLRTTTEDPTNGHIVSSNGYDIIFKDSGGTQLDHEIEDYDGSASGGTLVAWVRIPTLDYNDDTVIYMYYGNTCITSSQENVTGVWSNNYEAVWHLSEDPTDSSPAFKDSTSNNNDGTDYGS
ncbi:MAG TPA: DUF2341 domain-containing protein, partial [Dehalococcoidia bacterium]|nr:DUF2341 domain-containing protein [Dehalococcoidia bacterium]